MAARNLSSSFQPANDELMLWSVVESNFLADHQLSSLIAVLVNDLELGTEEYGLFSIGRYLCLQRACLFSSLSSRLINGDDPHLSSSMDLCSAPCLLACSKSWIVLVVGGLELSWMVVLCDAA